MKHKVIIIILSIVIVGIASGIYVTKYTTASNKKTESSNTSKKKGIQPFSVKLPDGLYLYQPYIFEEWTLTHISKYHIRPLFIIKNNKITDPFVEARSMVNMELTFVEKYIKNTDYNIYLGKKYIGRIKFDLDIGNDCNFESKKGSLFEDIQIRTPFNNKIISKIPHIYPGYHPVLFLLTPTSYKSSGEYTPSKVTSKQKRHIIGKARSELFPKLIKRKVLSIGNIRNSNYNNIYIAAFDYDSNGKDDYLSIFYVKSEHRAHEGFYIMFFYRDNGDIEFIEKTNKRFSTIVDINNDGYMELVLTADIGSNIIGAYKSKITVLYRDKRKEWNTKFTSKWVLCRA